MLLRLCVCCIAHSTSVACVLQVCSVLYIVAAGLSCFFSTWTAAFIFLMLICCMSSVMWDYSAFMVKSAGEERETHPSSMEKGQTKVEAKQQENPVNNDVPNTKLPKQSPGMPLCVCLMCLLGGGACETN